MALVSKPSATVVSDAAMAGIPPHLINPSVQTVELLSACVNTDNFVSLPFVTIDSEDRLPIAGVADAVALPSTEVLRTKHFPCASHVCVTNPVTGNAQTLPLERPAVRVPHLTGAKADLRALPSTSTPSPKQHPKKSTTTETTNTEATLPDVDAAATDPSPDGVLPRVIAAPDGTNRVVVLSNHGCRHNVLLLRDQSVVDVVTSRPVLDASFHPASEGQLLLCLLTSGIVEAFLIPSVVSSQTSPVAVCTHRWRLRCSPHPSRQASPGSSHFDEPPMEDLGRQPRPVALSVLPPTVSTPAIGVFCSEYGDLFVCSLDLTRFKLDTAPTPSCTVVPLHIFDLSPDAGLRGEAADPGKRNACAAVALCIDERAGRVAVAVGRANGRVEITAVSEGHLLRSLALDAAVRKAASMELPSASTVAAVTPRPTESTLLPQQRPGSGVKSRSALDVVHWIHTVDVANVAATGPVTLRMQRGTGGTANSIIVGVTPHGPSVHSSAQRSFTTAEEPRRSALLLTIPVWCSRRSSWVFSLHPSVEGLRCAATDANTVPPPLAVPLPCVTYGRVLPLTVEQEAEQTQADKAAMAAFADRCAAGLPCLGDSVIAFPELHVRRSAFERMTGLAPSRQVWYKAHDATLPKGLIVSPLSVPLRHVLQVGLAASSSLGPNSVEFAAEPATLKRSTMLQLLEDAGKAAFATLVMTQRLQAAPDDRPAFDAFPTVEPTLRQAEGHLQTAVDELRRAAQEGDTRLGAVNASLEGVSRKLHATQKGLVHCVADAEHARMVAAGPSALYRLNDRLDELHTTLRELERP